jgi:hypothetical protein
LAKNSKKQIAKNKSQKTNRKKQIAKNKSQKTNNEQYQSCKYETDYFEFSMIEEIIFFN